MKGMLNKLQILSEALISLAYLEQSACQQDKRTEAYVIPVSASLSKIRYFDDVLVPTYNLPIKKDGRYSNIIGKLN